MNIILYHQNEAEVKKVLQCCDFIVDCVFGTRFYGMLEPKRLFEFINLGCNALKISVDIPSGMNSDTGETAENAFIPDITLTLGAVKKGLLCNPKCCGKLILLDIDVPDIVEYENIIDNNDIINYNLSGVKNDETKGYTFTIY